MARVKYDLGSIDKSRTSKSNRGELSIEWEGFDRYLRFEKRYSDYNAFQLISLAKRINKMYDVVKPCIDDAYRIEDDLKVRGVRDTTIRHYLRVLEILAEFQGVPLKCRKPRAVYRIPDSLTAEESRRLADSGTNLRDVAIVSLLLYCGLRSGELCRLDVSDIDLKERLVLIRKSKNRRERKTVMTMECANNLREWLDVRPDVGVALFFTNEDKRLSGLRLNRILKAIGRRAGIEKTVYPHLLRHSCASNMLRSGVPLSEVALQLGHRSLSSTMIYLHSNIEGLRDSLDKQFKY